MEDIVQAKQLIEEVKRDIEFFKATYWSEEDRQTCNYSKQLEQLYIRRTKAELNLRKLELRMQ